MRHIITGKNVVKYLISTQPFLGEDLYVGILNGCLRIKEFSKLSRNVVVLVYPDSKVENHYFVLKQVQKNDEAKIKSLRNEAFYMKKISKPFKFINFDFDNNILVYENNFELVFATHNDFSMPELTGKKLAQSLFDFHAKNQINAPFPKKNFYLLEDRQNYLAKLESSDDFSILEIIQFIKEHTNTFNEISEIWKKYNDELVIVHGDVKFPNLATIQSEDKFVLIDYELVGVAPSIYDLSNFMFNYLRYIKDWGNNGLDPKLNSSQIIDTIRNMIREYAQLKNTDSGTLERHAIYFFYIKTLENYLNGAFNRAWGGQEKNLEYYRVQQFKFIITNHSNISLKDFQ